jgi:hypothetical protein
MSICRRAEELLDQLGSALGADERRHVDLAIRQTRAAVSQRDAELAYDRAAIVAAWVDARTARGR